MADDDYTLHISIIPMTGDVIFCTGNSLIRSVQASSFISHRNITHAAIMASSTALAEGMYGEELHTKRLRTWHKDRQSQNPTETYFILRSLGAASKWMEIQRAILFYQREPYRLQAFLKWQNPGGSICTSFVAKVLTKSHVVSDFRGRNFLLPGILYKQLLARGWTEIPSRAFFNGLRDAGGEQGFANTLALLRILDELDLSLRDVQSQMIGWTYIIEKDLLKDPITYSVVLRIYTGKNINTLTRELIETCQILCKSIAVIKERGPHNWADNFKEHERRIAVLCKLASEHYELIKILVRTLSTERVQAAIGTKPEKPDTKIYENISTYLKSVQLAARTIRAILGTT